VKSRPGLSFFLSCRGEVDFFFPGAVPKKKKPLGSPPPTKKKKKKKKKEKKKGKKKKKKARVKEEKKRKRKKKAKAKAKKKKEKEKKAKAKAKKKGKDGNAREYGVCERSVPSDEAVGVLAEHTGPGARETGRVCAHFRAQERQKGERGSAAAAVRVHEPAGRCAVLRRDADPRRVPVTHETRSGAPLDGH
jgi:outer membrane biosynthesis protein TonB